jgi:hypothetical protein
MSCDCAKCRQHYKELGFAFGVPSEAEIQEAYKEAVKQWHPDLYENFASLRADAEERFKQIQVAYREMKEHSSLGAESPEGSPDMSVAVKREETPAISFNGAPGCLAAPQFTEGIKELVTRQMGSRDTAVAIIDLNGNFSQFLLLGARGMIMRDGRNIVSLLWYKDLGEVSLVDKGESGKSGLWQKFSGTLAGGQSQCQLRIFRNDNFLFLALPDKVDDNAKRVIYDFLLRQRDQAQV